MIGQITKPIIRVSRGDSFVRTLSISDGDGDLIDCSGWTIYFTVRSSVPDTSEVNNAAALISKEFSGTADGDFTFTLESEDTDIDPGTYLFDFQVEKDDGKIHSTRQGSFIVEGDITRGPSEVS